MSHSSVGTSNKQEEDKVEQQSSEEFDEVIIRVMKKRKNKQPSQKVESKVNVNEEVLKRKKPAKGARTSPK
jgi:phosphopantetheine adenylyltransferase